MAYNILVIDDSKTTRTVIIKTLKLTGIDFGKIFEAENGKEGLDCLHNEWIDIVLTDLNMPIMTGIELVDKMYEEDLLKSVPVIIISTDGSSARANDLKEKGVKEYIQKPFTPESLGQVIGEVMGGINEHAES